MLCTLLSITASAYDFEVNGIYYNIVSISDLTCEVTKGENYYIGDIVIPTTVYYKGKDLTVIGIGKSAFDEWSREPHTLTSIILPDKLEYIDSYAFQYCKSLSHIEFPNSLKRIGTDAFDNCKFDGDLFLPDNVKLNWDCFLFCKVAGTVTLPSNLEKLSYRALGVSCSELIIPKKMTTIEAENGHARHLVIPNNVIELGSQAQRSFSCDTLIIEDGEDLLQLNYSNWGSYSQESAIASFRYVYIGRPTSYMAGGLFTDRITRLEEKLCQKTVETIEIGKYCTEFSCNELPNLKKIVFHNETPPIVGKNSLRPDKDLAQFTNKQYMDIEIFVPRGSLAAYQSANIWQNFWNIQEYDDPTDIKAATITENNSEKNIYNIQGSKIERYAKGINIIKYSNGKVKKVLRK